MKIKDWKLIKIRVVQSFKQMFDVCWLKNVPKYLKIIHRVALLLYSDIKTDAYERWSTKNHHFFSGGSFLCISLWSRYYLETQLLTTLEDPVSDFSADELETTAEWSNHTIIMVILSQEFLPYRLTVLAQHMSKICSHNWLNTNLSLQEIRWESISICHSAIDTADTATR